MNNFNLHSLMNRNINNYRKCRIFRKPLKYIDVNNSLSRGQKHFSNHFMRNFNVEKLDMCTTPNSADIPSILNFKALFFIFAFSHLSLFQTACLFTKLMMIKKNIHDYPTFPILLGSLWFLNSKNQMAYYFKF